MKAEPNGAPANRPQILASCLAQPNGAKLVYTTSDGKYLGTVQFEAPDLGVIGILGSLFQQFCAEQTKSVQIAGAGALAGLNGHRTS